MILLDLLVSQGKITDENVAAIEADLREHPDAILDEKLVALKVPEQDIIQIRSTLYGLPIYKTPLSDDPTLSKLITHTQSRQMLALPLELKDDVLLIGIVDPDHGNVLDAIQFIFGPTHRAYKLYLITYSQFQMRISNKVRVGVTSEEKKEEEGRPTEVTDDEDDTEKEAADTNVDLTNVDGKLSSDLVDESVPVIFNTLLRWAIDNTASDLHIEHMGDKVRARFRVDGVLDTKLLMPAEIHQTLIARVKILCSLKLDEKRKPQDGRFSSKMEDHKIDYRVSTFPGYYGEKIVIRVLDSYKGVRALNTIGISVHDMQAIRNALEKPYGIVLISGPTGSGKTTTLYSMMGEIDKEHRNVVSLEDPIEYNIASINQSQVFPEIGYTFASGLRSILRQDPDVIMVGEIRDAETAGLAIQAALTGHLVFSTIHTNTAIGVITRLLDMGIEPYLIAPTIIATIGQRLVRSIAEGCGKEMEMDPGMKTMLETQFKDLPPEFKKDLPLANPFFTAVGSKDNPSGLKGRLPVFEVLTIDNDIQAAIIGRKSEEDIWKLARAKGMTTLKEDAMLKCLNKKIPFSEIATL